MSGPFRFHEEARSPLDRSASPFSAGQPVSFKTNINRAKTKKWVQAKKNAYDGDDWGDYDEYDEYGVNQEPQQEKPAAQRYYAQRTEQPSRSFTDPSQQAPPLRARKNSFDQGEEQRAFSSTISHSQPVHGHPHGDSREQPYGYDTGGVGDFSPSAVPPPLQPRISQVPANFTPPSNNQFPPRKSSIGQGDLPIVNPPRPRNGSGSDKPLPIVRPADIYKRHQEENERASLESARPNIDSIASQAQEGGKPLQPMETVAERKSEHLHDSDAAAAQNEPQSSHQELPTLSPSDDDDLRSVVNQAFTRVDDSRSVPPTPTSNDTSSDLLRSNTGSTAGISPIMSRVPSSAASALKNRNQAEGSTPVITEEPAEASTPVAQPTSENNVEPLHHVPRKPSPAHSRNISSSSTPRSGLATPTRGDSPARSPVLAPSRDIPEPKSALFSTEDDASPEAMEGGLKGPSLEYATREADLATSNNSRPNSGVFDLGAAQRQSQNMFLESHNAQSPIDDVVSRDRSESPSKGRVQALAGKFGEVSSRRGSTQSNRSRNSVQSWEQSQNNSRAASPTKGSPSKPSSPVKEFRPHLPGQWESYTTTVMTPSEHGEQERGLSTANDNKTSLEKSDLTPTTAKQSVAEVPPTEADNADPMTALKNAGAAMVESIRTTIGIDEKPTEGQQDQKQPAERGDVYLPRPLQLDRTITSDSSAPPTPPAKDTPQPEVSPSPSEEKSPQTVEEDEESDRLRKEIVASLSPFKAPESPTGESNLTPLQPGSPGTNRASSIFPSEYKTYWAEEDRASRRSSQASEHKTQEQPPTATVAFLPQSEDPTKPVIKRFSWEANSPHLPTPDGETKEVSVTEPPKAAEEPKEESPLPVELPAESERQQQPESLSASSLGPIHTLTVTKPDPINDPEKPVEPSPPLDLTRPTASPTLERTHSPGLHVVNTEIDPEAVDLPPRFSADNEPPPPPAPEEPKLIEKAATPEPTETHPAMEPRTEEPSISATTLEPSSKAPVTDKPLGAREIATLNSPVERIDTYNKTRDYWAKVDHGLSDWLTAALDANPDLATQTYPVQRVPTQSVRHRHTGSLLFGKLGGSSSHDLPAEQHNDAPVPVPASTSSPTAGPSSGSGFGGRLANQHMQLKGKDLLHTANVLGGKGMTSAKGLFAKGKSRFGREKASSRPPTDSAPSSREVSEEPETVTRRSRAEGRWNAALMSLATERGKGKGAPNEEKQKTKKRFSFTSQLRRVSRSRSRSNSVALPNETVSSGDPQSHTFHAPDTWSSHPGMPAMGLNEYFNTTPPRQQASQPRLGVLPSPVKSTSSGQGKNTERHVPPVPPIPDGVAIKHYRRRSSQDNASHQILQSVIRHSSRPTAHNRHSMPPIMTKEKQLFIEDPVFNDDMQPGAVERAEDYKALMRVPKGAFQPDLPTAESENSYKHGFQFGFTDDVLPKAKDNHDDADYGDDDDQPPKLNEDPVPAPMPSKRQSVITDVYVDVSDEDDSDDGLFRGRNMAKLRAESTTRSKAETSLNGLEGADEQVTYHNAALMVGLRRFGHDGNAILTVQTQPRSSTEAEVLVADDVSYTSHPSPDHKGDDTAVRPDQAAAERALSPVWFTKKDLELPMRNSAPKETETLPTQCTASPDLVQDPDSTAIGEIRTAGQPPAATRTDGEISLRPDLAGVEADTSQARQVSALPTHAAQGKISSSAASWHLRETVTLPLFDAHTLGDMSETSSVVTPVAHVPRILRSEPETPKAGPWHDDGSHGAVPDVQAHVHDNFPDLKPQALQLQASHATMASPVRSKSILSQISAMVSEENKTPYSHASYGRSTPSAALRMRPEFSKRLPPAPVHIPEETPASHDDRAANGEDDDFDLYADHNGIVKDVCDENGQPLRVAEAQESAQVPPNQLARPLAPDVTPARASQDEEPPRYSTERPMSFIAGPADQDGKPQDQINQESYRPRRLETIYSELPTNSPDPSLDQSQPSSASISPPPSSPPPKNILRAVRSIDPTRPAKQALLDQTHSSEEANSQGSLLAEANTHDQLPQNGHVTNQALHQPQPQRAQPILQGIFRGQSPSPVPQVQTPEQGPRNQYELRQQLLQQASNARLQGVQKQPSISPEPPSADEASKPHEKSSTKTTVSSMFKKFGGKTHVHLHHTIPPTPPFDPRFSGESSPAAPLNRSKVEQKHHSVQTAPDLNLKKPESPGIFHRVTLQQPRSATSIKSMPYDMLHPDAQPGPKKKRFSHLGAFFHKGGAGGDNVAAKLKPSKDDKKAQKAHQNSSAASTESQVWHWDTQKQRYINKKTDQTGNSSDKPQQDDGQGQNQESMQGTRSNEGSAFLSTKQLAEEHQAQQSSQQALQANNNSYTTPLAQGPSVPFDRLQQRNQDSPIAEYYKPITDHVEDQRGAYAATTAAIQWREQQKQLLRQGPDSQVAPQAQHLQAHRQNDQSVYGQSNHRNSRYEQEQGREPSSRPQSELIFNQVWLGQREQKEQEREQSVHRRHGQSSSNGHGMPQQIPHHHQALPLHLKIGNQHPLSNPPITPGQGYQYNPQDVLVSPAEPSGPSEPKYEPTPIPAAYNHVSGAFVSPLDQPQQPVYPPQGGQATYALPNRAGWQYGDPGMPVLTPQVSVQSAMHPYHRTYSDASVVSMMTPVQDPFTAHNSSPHPSMPRAHRPRMSSISETQQHQQQQQQQGRPWHLNFPAGATEQEIVRARQGQYMQELFNAQQQQQAERAAGSPSPRMAPRHVTPIVTALHNHAPGGGFREIMPTNPSHPYAPQHPALMHQEEHFTAHRDPHDRSAAAPPHPAAYPQHISHEPTGDPAATNFSPVPQPPPKVPFSPIGHPLQDAQMNPINGQHHLRSHSVDHPYGAPHNRMSHYEEQVPEEAPPSYEGIGIPNDGMDKSRPEAVRPPNINTDVNGHDPDQRPGVRQRQSSIGMLQHPQPASMAASPQRTFSDMGAESLRLQLLQQENLVKMERIQREQERREALMRERQEREAARARARELERSVSAGGQVGSLRSAGGSGGWDRGNSYNSSHSRAVFELPAVVDDEDSPVMKATSYPGQEWVPSVWEGD